MLRIRGGSEAIRQRDWLLIVGLILSPMTGLRIAKVGPAEVLCLIWVLLHAPKARIIINNITSFFLVFLGSMFIGTIWCLAISPREIVYDHWFTWIYLTIISIGMYNGLSKNTIDYNVRIFDLFSRGAAIWYLLLFVYSRVVSTSFLGAPLWYYGYRFTGGATNPHQIAVLMCGLTFCFTRYVFSNKKPVVNALFAIVCLYLELQTASSTGIVALVLAFAVTAFIVTGHTVQNRTTRYIFYVFEAVIIILVAVLGYSFFYRTIYSWILSDSNGLGRINLLHQIGNSFKKSPIFGLGPGVHAFDTFGNVKEYHNTYLEIIATTGLVGMAAFVILTIRTMKNMLVDDFFIPIMIAIYAYGLGGFAMRRLAYWGLFIFIFVLSEQMRKKSDEEIASENALQRN